MSVWKACACLPKRYLSIPPDTWMAVVPVALRIEAWNSLRQLCLCLSIGYCYCVQVICTLYVCNLPLNLGTFGKPLGFKVLLHPTPPIHSKSRLPPAILLAPPSSSPESFMNFSRALFSISSTARPYLKPKVNSNLIRRFAVSTNRAMTEYKLKGITSLSLKPGDKQEVEVEGLEDAKVLVVNAGGTIQALGPKCTHYGAPLVKGVLTKGGRLTCPWHGGKSVLFGPSQTGTLPQVLTLFSMLQWEDRRRGRCPGAGCSADIQSDRARRGYLRPRRGEFTEVWQEIS